MSSERSKQFPLAHVCKFKNRTTSHMNSNAYLDHVNGVLNVMMVLLPQEQCIVFLWIIQIPSWPKIGTGITKEILIQHYRKI